MNDVEVREIATVLRRAGALIEELLAAVERLHPKGAHFGYGIVGKAENGANVWGSIDYGIGCDICDLIARAKGEA